MEVGVLTFEALQRRHERLIQSCVSLDILDQALTISSIHDTRFEVQTVLKPDGVFQPIL